MATQKDSKEHGKDSLIAAVSDANVAAWINAYCEAHGVESPSINLSDTSLGDAPTLVNGGAEIVIVQGGEADADALIKLEKLCAYITSGGSFIVILDNPTTDTVRRLFRAGVTDVLPTPVAENELVAALDTARQQSLSIGGPVADAGKIITVMKTAGGVGATTVAVNLAREFSHAGVQRVAVVDLDIQFGGIGLALDLQPRMNITDAIRAGGRLDATLLKTVMTSHRAGFDVLPAPPNLTPLNVIDDQFIVYFFENLRASYDIVVLELPTAWRQWISSVVEGSDIVAPIVETTVRSADGARRIVQGLEDISISDPGFFPIANKVENLPSTRDRLKNLGTILGEAPAARIRMDAKLAAESSDLGRSFRDVNAGAPVTQDFVTAAARLITRLNIPAEIQPAAEERKGLRIGNLTILGGKS